MPKLLEMFQQELHARPADTIWCVAGAPQNTLLGEPFACRSRRIRYSSVLKLENKI